MRVVSTLVVACACSAPSTPTADAPDLTGDAPPTGTARLTVGWSVSPGVPAAIGADRALDDVRFRIESFQVLGDGNPSSAPAIAERKLRWNEELTPMPVVFDGVPIGLYTSIVFRLREGDGEDAFEIQGTVETDEERDFEIHDTDTLSITVTGFDLELGAGHDATVDLAVDLGMIAGIDFASMDTTDGDYVIERGVHPQIDTFRTQLSGAFSAVVVSN
jgi:hypothetical protein